MSTSPVEEDIRVTEDSTFPADPVGMAVQQGLTASPKQLPAWLFYDEAGSTLFEQITVLPEYYLTRTERGIFTGYADGIITAAAALRGEGEAQPLRMLELGAGSASKTGVLLSAAVRRQGRTDYLPIDVSASAMEEACDSITRSNAAVTIYPQVANYVTDVLDIPFHSGPTLALYIGSSIGNFGPEDAKAVLQNLRAQLRPGDSLLLGTDLVKDAAPLLAAYDDAEGVTAAFNKNVLVRLNMELGADFDLDAFEHQAIWNSEKSRIEMHLRSTIAQTVFIPSLAMKVEFAKGETIHTENSYKFTAESIAALLQSAGFRPVRTWNDEKQWFAVTLAAAE